MSEKICLPEEDFKNYGWRNVFAGVGINLALGILYTWSVISKGVPAEWGWTDTDKSLPYMFACLIFALVMVPAGRIQDKFGPRVVATVGGIMVGIGFLLASLTTLPLGFIIGFGVLAGAGIGCGYASATPAAVKWFPPAKTGMIAGIVVSGFGLASVYAAPLAKWLTGSYGIANMMRILGLAFLVVVVGLAQFLKAPHKVLQFIKEYGHVGALKAKAMAAEAKPPAKKEDYTPKEMLGTAQFYMLWFMYACGAGAGLMIISKLASIAAQPKIGISLGFLLVAVLAVGNGGGRIIAGMASDKVGRKTTMFICFVLQAVLILLLSMAHKDNIIGTVPVMAIISALIGANYGANLALFPSITKDYYGLRNFGTNYGLVFTSWGVGGFMLAFLAGKMFDIYQTYAIAYYGASLLLVLAAITVFFVKPPYQPVEIVQPAEANDTVDVEAETEMVEV